MAAGVPAASVRRDPSVRVGTAPAYRTAPVSNAAATAVEDPVEPVRLATFARTTCVNASPNVVGSNAARMDAVAPAGLVPRGTSARITGVSVSPTAAGNNAAAMGAAVTAGPARWAIPVTHQGNARTTHRTPAGPSTTRGSVPPTPSSSATPPGTPTPHATPRRAVRSSR